MKASLMLSVLMLLTTTFVGCATPEYEVTPVKIPNYIITGEPVVISRNITNIGNSRGVYTARLNLDGITIDTKEITLSPGATGEISFQLRIDSAGEHLIELNGFQSELTAIAPNQLMNLVYQRLKDINTSEGNMTLNLDIKVSESDVSYKMGMVLDSDYKNDSLNEKFEMTADMTLSLAGEPIMNGTMELYFIDNIMYSKMDFPGEPAEWIKERTPDDYWKQLIYVEEQIDIARNAEINFLGFEQIRGNRCFVIKVIPSKEVLLEAMLGQIQANKLWGEEIDSITTLFSGLIGTAMDVSMKIWISEDSLLVQKTDILAEIDLSGFGFSMDLGMEIDVHSYNSPVEIKLPSGASQAGF